MGKSVLMDLVFPARCPVCGEIMNFGYDGVCAKCSKVLPWVKRPVCLKCGKMIEDQQEEYCSDCSGIPKSFERCYPAFCYEGDIKDSIYRFKYKNDRENAKFYSDSILKLYGNELRLLNADGIVPVPVHKNKRRARGYNQAELVAHELGRKLSIPVFPNYIIRINDTEPQKELDNIKRIKNLKNAFIIGKNDVKLDTVLLVDDIYTSGATMEACTRVLLSSGSFKVYGTAIAIGKGY